MAEFPALLLWTDSYLADTAARLTAEEHGVYQLLMQLAWREGNETRLPPLDDCVLWIKGVCKGMHGRTAGRLVGAILAKHWTTDEDGLFFQKRLEKEWKKVRNTSDKRSKGARKRWETQSKPETETSGDNDLTQASHMHRARVSKPNQAKPVDSESCSPSESLKPSSNPAGVVVPRVGAREGSPPNGVGHHKRSGISEGSKGNNQERPRAETVSPKFYPSDEWVQQDLTLCGGNLTTLAIEVEKFIDHFLSGERPVKSMNWDRKFRTWLRKREEIEQDNHDERERKRRDRRERYFERQQATRD